MPVLIRCLTLAWLYLLKARLGAMELQKARTETQRLATMAEAGRNLSNSWLHVDMDAFFAAVETLDNPSYAQVPMAVGGIGMISTANYEARKYGVRSAMPGFIAIKLCPSLVFVKSDFTKYTKVVLHSPAVPHLCYHLRKRSVCFEER